jgi:hypothetical protein
MFKLTPWLGEVFSPGRPSVGENFQFNPKLWRHDSTQQFPNPTPERPRTQPPSKKSPYSTPAYREVRFVEIFNMKSQASSKPYLKSTPVLGNFTNLKDVRLDFKFSN